MTTVLAPRTIPRPSDMKSGRYNLVSPDGSIVGASFVRHKFFKFPGDQVEYSPGYLRGEGWTLLQYLGPVASEARGA